MLPFLPCSVNHNAKYSGIVDRFKLLEKMVVLPTFFLRLNEYFFEAFSGSYYRSK